MNSISLFFTLQNILIILSLVIFAIFVVTIIIGNIYDKCECKKLKNKKDKEEENKNER